jgi:two-component system response regulator YesN
MPHDWHSLPQTFSSLLMFMSNRGINNKGMILSKTYDASVMNEGWAHYESCLQKMALYKEKINILETYLESGQREAFFRLLNEIKEKLLPIVHEYNNLGVEVFYFMSLRFLAYVNRYDTLLKKLSVHPEYASIMRIHAATPYEEAFQCFFEIGDRIFMYQQDENEKRENVLIVKIHEYINNNLEKDLSLVRLAELVHFNPTYLSRLYKSITGYTLSSFIHNSRMRKAKSMLKDGKAKVYEIATAVGYESDTYFIRIFKKSTGMTPQEYATSATP